MWLTNYSCHGFRCFQCNELFKNQNLLEEKIEQDPRGNHEYKLKRRAKRREEKLQTAAHMGSYRIGTTLEADEQTTAKQAQQSEGISCWNLPPGLVVCLGVVLVLVLVLVLAALKKTVLAKRSVTNIISLNTIQVKPGERTPHSNASEGPPTTSEPTTESARLSSTNAPLNS